MSVRRLTQDLDTDVPVPTRTHERQGVAIFALHGVIDGTTTGLAAAVSDGAYAEINPLMAMLLHEGVGFAIGTMLLATGVVAVAYPWVAAIGDPLLPDWYPRALIVVGAVIALANIVYIVAKTGVVA